MLVMGMVTATIVEVGALGPETNSNRTDSFLVDFVLLLWTTLLATTYTSWGSTAEWRNPAERRLGMMRMLPVPVSTLIRSRMALHLVSLAILVPAFFGPIYLIGDIQLNLGAYAAFVAFWAGYALVWGGLTLYLDVVRGSRFVFLSSFISAPILIGLIVLVSFVLEVQVVETVGQLSRDYGLVTGLAALSAGVAAFVLAGHLTARDLPDREIAV
jgi:hypothetical protein